MKLKLIIKGAYYYSEEKDIVLMAHFTGEFFSLDCTQYFKKNEAKNRGYEYDKENYIIHEHEKYYECEYSQYTTDQMILISDLSELHHIEENYDF